MRYLPILLLLAGCYDGCPSGGCLSDKQVQAILDTASKEPIYPGVWNQPAPTQPLLEVPMIPSPNTVIIIPPGVIYGY